MVPKKGMKNIKEKVEKSIKTFVQSHKTTIKRLHPSYVFTHLMLHHWENVQKGGSVSDTQEIVLQKLMMDKELDKHICKEFRESILTDDVRASIAYAYKHYPFLWTYMFKDRENVEYLFQEENDVYKEICSIVPRSWKGSMIDYVYPLMQSLRLWSFGIYRCFSHKK